MTSLETTAVPVGKRVKKTSLLVRLYRAIERHRLERARRQVLIQLSHYDAHMLRDMGIDPRDVEAALNRRSLSMLFNPIRPEGR